MANQENPTNTFLPSPGNGGASSAPEPMPGERIGPFRLLQRLGAGGMGVVWEADQIEPIRRHVAVKFVKLGMDSKEVIARFEAERQALALMDHPNIAKVFDAGLTPTGRPYFAMELVKGLPITKYCDEAKLTIRQRMELFLLVCNAVQHAHQKGVIHRDLKPSNVLVALYDGKPVPKVIDFGLAKALHQPLTNRTIFTEQGMMLGTPEYMAPEQASVNALDIDTRADIYSLGVILYELMTGQVLFERKVLRQVMYDEMLRMICEVEPLIPSKRLASIATLSDTAIRRGLEPKSLVSILRGDIDWIVMKALEKDRNRRYETANGFGMDVQRYLEGKAVLAHPPSRWYLVQKFVKRNRGQVLAAGLVFVALLVGIVGTAFGMLEAQRQASIATDEKSKAVAAAEKERAAKDEALRNLDYSNQGNKILGSVFEGLDPKANYATVAELRDALKKNLRKAGNDLEHSIIGDPMVVASMQNTLGLSLYGLGESQIAIGMFEKAWNTRSTSLGAVHPYTLHSMNNLALSYLSAGQREKAMPLLKRSLFLSQVNLGPEHPETIVSLNNLAEGYFESGNYDEALPLYEKAFELTMAKNTEYPHTLMINLARCYTAFRNFDKALPLYEKTLKIIQTKLGPDHPETLRNMGSLGLSYWIARKLDKALPLIEKTLELQKQKMGLDHPHTLTTMNNLALCYQDAGELDKALLLYEQTLKLRKVKLGTEHPDTLTSMNNLAWGFQAAGKLDSAIPLYEQTLELRKSKLGSKHPHTLISLRNLGGAYALSGNVEKATIILAAYIDGLRKQATKDSRVFSAQLAEESVNFLRSNQFITAEVMLRECLATREKQEPDDWRTFNTHSLLGGALIGQKKYAEAEPLLLKGYEGMQTRQKSIPQQGATRIPEAIDRLIQLYTETNKPDEVKKWKREKLTYLARQAL